MDSIRCRGINLSLEVVGEVLRAVVVPQLETLGDLRADPAEVLTHALPDWLQRLTTRRAGCSDYAHELARAVIDGNEHSARNSSLYRTLFIDISLGPLDRGRKMSTKA